MKLTPNFYLEEFTKSVTAVNHKIDNKLPDEYLDTVLRLADELQIVRSQYRKPIVISSGYRCPELNKIVGGVSNSDHLYGAAVDICSGKNTKEENRKLFDLIAILAHLGKVHFRQIIDEHYYSWIHVSINHENNEHKENQVLHLK